MRKLALIFVLLCGSASAQTVYTICASGCTSTTNFVAPARVTSAIVECWGGGGAGARAAANTTPGGGGKGGSYAKVNAMPLTPGNTYTPTLGAGGVSATPTNGGATDFIGDAATHCTAAGGNTPAVSSLTGATTVNGTSVGDVNNAGGNGADGSGTNAGGGGEAGGSVTVGAAASGSTGGSGNNADGGDGGAGRTASNGVGIAGTAPGGAGGGALRVSTTSNNGGAGGAGRVQITYQFAATPTYNNDAGTYSSAVTVTISDATGSSTIKYCTDTTNTCAPQSGTTYTVPVTISTGGTYLRSSATASGYNESATKSAVYWIGPFALVATSPATPGCSGTTTCSVTLTSSLVANHLLTVQCRTPGTIASGQPVALQSANVGGTLVPVASASGAGNFSTVYPANGYIYPTSATAGPIVLTFTGSMTAGTTCLLREYSISAGTPKLDWADATWKTGTTSATGETPAFTGSNDLVVQAIAPGYAAPTAVAGYADGIFDATNTTGWADVPDTTSTTAPTWTIASGSGSVATSGMAFATDATACSDYGFFDQSGGTNGNVVTAATLNSSTFGLPTTGLATWALSSSPATGITWANGTTLGNLPSAIPTCGSGSKGTASDTLSLQLDYSTIAARYVYYTPASAQHKTTVQFEFKTDFATVTENFDAGSVGAQSQNMVNWQYGLYGGTSGLGLECFGGAGATNFSAGTAVSANTEYSVCVRNDDAVGGSMKIYETTNWTQVGSTATCTASGWTAAPADTVGFGQPGASATHPVKHIWYGKRVVDPRGGACPLYLGSAPSASKPCTIALLGAGPC